MKTVIALAVNYRALGGAVAVSSDVDMAEDLVGMAVSDMKTVGDVHIIDLDTTIYAFAEGTAGDVGETVKEALVGHYADTLRGDGGATGEEVKENLAALRYLL